MSTTTTTPQPDVPLPDGAATLDDWTPDHPQPYRIVFGANRGITDHAAKVGTSASSGLMERSMMAVLKRLVWTYTD